MHVGILHRGSPLSPHSQVFPFLGSVRLLVRLLGLHQLAQCLKAFEEVNFCSPWRRLVPRTKSLDPLLSTTEGPLGASQDDLLIVQARLRQGHVLLRGRGITHRLPPPHICTIDRLIDEVHQGIVAKYWRPMLPGDQETPALCHNRWVNSAPLDQVAGFHVGLSNNATSEEPQHQFGTPFNPAEIYRHALCVVAELPTTPFIHQVCLLLAGTDRGSGSFWGFGSFCPALGAFSAMDVVCACRLAVVLELPIHIQWLSEPFDWARHDFFFYLAWFNHG